MKLVHATSGRTMELVTAAPRYVGFRALHRSEGGRPTPDGMPCVVPSLNVAGILFTQDMQLLSYALVSAVMSKEKWRVVYGKGTAFCNQNGFNDPSDPRRDYVNIRDLTAEYPKLMRGIVCAGNFFTGRMVGSELVCTPGVDAIDGNKPMPSAQEVISRHWYFVATTAKYDAAGVWRVNNFPQAASGKAPLSYAWSRNGSPIDGATASSYTTNNVQVADSGSLFNCLVSNVVGTARSSNALLTVLASPMDYFTEKFRPGRLNDLAYRSFTFTPDGSSNYYAVCQQAASAFPTDPTGGTTVSLTDDAYAQVTLSGTNTVAIYNRRSNVFFIGSNGYLTMGSGDTNFSPSYTPGSGWTPCRTV